MKRFTLSLTIVAGVATVGCTDDDGDTDTNSASLACDGEPVVMTTAAGVDFVRTPDTCFDGLVDWPYAPRYVELDGLRQAYVDEGPAEGPVVLLLHGQPSWSYLYRKMIPVLVDGGYRVIAMDHLGMGRSDKPIDIDAYTYLGHNDRLLRFIEQLDLRDINLFVQDWGSLIGLRVAGLNPERFARLAVGNGALSVIPAGVQPFPAVENPNEVEDIPSIFEMIPAQQVPFYDGCERLLPGESDFGAWMNYAMKAESFTAAEVIEGGTWFDIPPADEAAYDAPFPSRIYMAGARKFPSIVNELPGQNEAAWAGLRAFERPFATIWASNDPGGLGSCESQDLLVLNIPGSTGMPHVRLPESGHFLQDDQGEEIGRRLVDIYAAEPLQFNSGARYCEILLVRQNGEAVEAEVWGTQNIGECPADSWAAIDTDAIQAETGAAGVILNGPRIGVLSDGVVSGGERGLDRRTFGDLEMRYLATLQITPNQLPAPYTESTVRRKSRFVVAPGDSAYVLTAPDGSEYVMISILQAGDAPATVAELPNLGARLALPDGWAYEMRTPDSELVLLADGTATILQDDLQNTYQRTMARTSTTSDDPGLVVLPDGTGTPCANDADCAGLDAALCVGDGTGGFCTVEGCMAGGCGAPYVCCFGCNPAAAAALPFEESACIPAEAAPQLAGAGCTCE